jgi:D-glycerate 3-kinase
MDESRQIVSPETILAPLIAERLGQPGRRPLVVGLCGAQGSGKSTLAAALARRFPRAVALSLDDLYLTHAERRRLGLEVHPLLATRGVPGTHDIGLGLATFAALDRGEAVRLPRFDKARDDRVEPDRWPMAPEGCQLVIFEGWCVGARPQPAEKLVEPVNSLERERDTGADWRRYVNAALSGPYATLFARIDLLFLLAAPGWDQVFAWRLEQEQALRRVAPGGDGLMDETTLRTFVSHYERLTRWILSEMPARADLTLRLAADRQCIGVEAKPGS